MAQDGQTLETAVAKEKTGSSACHVLFVIAAERRTNDVAIGEGGGGGDRTRGRRKKPDAPTYAGATSAALAARASALAVSGPFSLSLSPLRAPALTHTPGRQQRSQQQTVWRRAAVALSIRSSRNTLHSPLSRPRALRRWGPVGRLRRRYSTPAVP